ncbi:hypothetical protein SEEN953_05071 [Salmonella enterica subsp. enterica serovar Newport str. CVM 33953]|nr:hypothetical protein SEEN953_05071 [Salmonella enterica subsp. enterica serovar Newport str. CVM 33953]
MRWFNLSLVGLSPLARGTHDEEDEPQFFTRFIPAGAGNTRSVQRGGYHPPVYPRWRGEHKRGSPSLGSGHGLSPLARGTHLDVKGSAMTTRFIPAGAGNT